MLNVFIDHQKFSTQKYGGISRYFANIIQGIKRTDGMTYKLGVLHAKNHYIQNESLPIKGPVSDKILNRNERYDYRLNQLYCKRLLEKSDFDVFHPTYYDPYFIDLVKKPLVITIHDMTYERLPEYFWAQDPLTYQKRLNIERADSIITISNTTRKDMLSFFDVDPAKVSVIYHGIDIETPLQVQPVNNLPPYILFVGDRSGYKNFYLFMNAFRQIARRFPDLHVVLAGGGKLEIADREFLDRLGLTDRVRHINATDEELNFLYQNAQFFVYPSLYEGFGLPILEAFKAHCPILLSDTECFREVAVDAAAYFEPTQIDDLIDKLELMLTSTTLKAALVEKGLKRLADFPLQKSIDQTLDVYTSLVGKPAVNRVLA
ncbi:glycosyltransferase family 4 protein [Spirosoma agri]|uniref:Glycosyltransferase family 4 protein n=1 Tax=Spirosoma agri TaxID=1987381 RepID=A0A6M0II03_9BACT|nr:glycosyltransferase family 1 protein [Spirosoma agri]NEU66961.1 glycosyltransferase family 4 protein [Spirosoma agri]